MGLSNVLWSLFSAGLNYLLPTTRCSLQRRLSFLASCLFLFSLCSLEAATAQVVSNGQIFTNGLAIVDSPQPNTPLHAGSTLNFAVDISGDGLLSADASIPYSGKPTSFNALGVFLVSAQTLLNVTVSSSPSLLTQEPGSTVKHLKWEIPSCLPAGSYNLTIYECALVDGVPRFSITPIPVTLDNASSPGSCSFASNPLFPQPQSSNPPPTNPFLNPTFSPTPTTPSRMSTSVSPGPTGIITITVGSTGIGYPLTLYGSKEETFVFQTPPSTGGGIITVTGNVIPSASAASGSVQEVTVTVSPTPVTVVFVSLSTVVSTLTAPTQTVVETSIVTSLSTTTAMMDIMNAGDNTEGFLPINSATTSSIASILPFTLSIFIGVALSVI